MGLRLLEKTIGQNITEHNDMRVYSIFKQDVPHCGREQNVFRCQHLYSYCKTLILSSIIGISYDIQEYNIIFFFKLLLAILSHEQQINYKLRLQMCCDLHVTQPITLF
jgi:hypothetical protein